MGDWTITLEPTVTNAADAVAAANQFNKPAPDGKQFVMVKVNATYNGAGQGVLGAGHAACRCGGQAWDRSGSITAAGG